MSVEKTIEPLKIKGVGCDALVQLLMAYEVTVYEMSCVIFAKNPAQARWLAVKSWRNAGMGGPREWPPVHALRKTNFDKFPLRESRPGQCWTPDYVRQCC